MQAFAKLLSFGKQLGLVRGASVRRQSCFAKVCLETFPGIRVGHFWLVARHHKVGLNGHPRRKRIAVRQVGPHSLALPPKPASRAISLVVGFSSTQICVTPAFSSLGFSPTPLHHLFYVCGGGEIALSDLEYRQLSAGGFALQCGKRDTKFL
jgi:hypothetical protein